MCGIFAVFQKTKPVLRDAVQIATDTLAHRGPDNSGVHFTTVQTPNGEIHAGFGHRRLSIIDLDARSHQPFCDEGGILTYNGEIYNFADMREELARVRPLRTQSDTEVLHRCLAASGDAEFGRFNGMWAFCFLDERRKTVIASRDRYGKKPLFYYADEDTFCMASEAKAIFSYLGMKPKMRPEKVHRHLAFGMSYPDTDGTAFFEGIREVRPGQTLELDLTNWALSERPWHYFAQTATSERGDLRETFEKAVLSRLLSDRPVGLLLSGGLDSSIILSVLMKHGLQHRVHCFIGASWGDVSDDATYARQCAELAGVVAQEVPSDYGANALDQIVSMCLHHEKPFPFNGNSVGMHQMYAHIAEHDVPVVLDGTGGDEVFGGYWDRYFYFAARDAMRAGDVDWLSGTLSAAKEDPELAVTASRALRRLSTEQKVARTSGHPLTFGREAVRKASYPDTLATYDGDLTGAMILDASRGRLPEWIWHNDRNAMTYGIENRSPFLDASLISLIGQHYSDKFNGPWNKLKLRELFSDFVELPTQWRRQKQGFRWRAGPFLTDNLDPVLEIVTGSSILKENIDLPKYLASVRKDNKLATGDFTSRLLCIAALESVF